MSALLRVSEHYRRKPGRPAIQIAKTEQLREEVSAEQRVLEAMEEAAREMLSEEWRREFMDKGNINVPLLPGPGGSS